MAATNPRPVCGSASTSTVSPSSRAVADVIGPMDAIFTPPSAASPAADTEFFTVDELVNVIQCGLRAKTSRA